MRLRNLVDVDADHCLAETAGDISDDLRIIVVLGCLDDSLGALLRITGLEDTGTNKDTLSTCLLYTSDAADDSLV